MPDQIIGLCVLQPTWVPPIYRLWFTAMRSDGSFFQEDIFIRDAALPQVPEKFPGWGDGCNSIWQFTRTGDYLDCHPSVNCLNDRFHNSYNWRVEYVEMILPQDRDHEKEGHWIYGSTVHHDLNYDLLYGMATQDEVCAKLIEMHRLGIIPVI